MENELRTKIEELKKVYADRKDEIFLQKADGNLSKLCNLRSEFDETFDLFFDNEELRKKYDAWNIEEGTINFDITNSDLEITLDDEDAEKYINFLNKAIDNLEEN
jgi:hypothetical protein